MKNTRALFGALLILIALILAVGVQAAPRAKAVKASPVAVAAIQSSMVVIQDDSAGHVLSFDTSTGAYTFCASDHLSLSGTGAVKMRGSVATLSVITGDRRINATYDGGVGKASATVQVVGRTYTLADRNTADDSGICP